MYAHVIESFACILHVLVLVLSFHINFLISFGIYSTPKGSKSVALPLSHTKLFNE